jgi:hypothetical protein
MTSVLSTVMVSISNDSVFINNALVVSADIETDNGVVHVIDAVLLPELTNVRNIRNSGLDISVFPNPTSDVLNIRMEDPNITNAQVFLWDLQGRRVLNQVLDRGQHQLQISNLNAGTYFLEFRIGNERFQLAVMIQR